MEADVSDWPTPVLPDVSDFAEAWALTVPEPAPLPEFRMPVCMKHFFKGHKWWCRRCACEVEREFRDVCEIWWEACRLYPSLHDDVDRERKLDQFCKELIDGLPT